MFQYCSVTMLCQVHKSAIMMKEKYRLLINLLSFHKIRNVGMLTNNLNLCASSSWTAVMVTFQLYHCVGEVVIQYHGQSIKVLGKSYWRWLNCKSTWMFSVYSCYGSIDGLGAMLQAGRLRAQVPMRLLNFFSLPNPSSDQGIFKQKRNNRDGKKTV
jgi:hypothetical protein